MTARPSSSTAYDVASACEPDGQREVLVEEGAAAGDDLVAADLVVVVAGGEVALARDDVGAVERVVERAPAGVGGVGGEAGVEQRHHELRAGDAGHLVVDVGGGHRDLGGLVEQVADLAQEGGVGLAASGVPGCSRCQSSMRRLQLVAAGEQLAVARRQVVDDRGGARPEGLGVDARSRAAPPRRRSGGGCRDVEPADLHALVHATPLPAFPHRGNVHLHLGNYGSQYPRCSRSTVMRSVATGGPLMPDVPDGPGTPPAGGACSRCTGPSTCSRSSRPRRHLTIGEIAAGDGRSAGHRAPAAAHPGRPRLHAPDTRPPLRPRLPAGAAGASASSMVGAGTEAVLGRLVDALGETANLAMLTATRRTTSRRCPVAHAMRMFTEVGRRVHPHCTAVGKALLGAARRRRRRGMLAPHRADPPHRAHPVTDVDAARRAGRGARPRLRPRRGRAGGRRALRRRRRRPADAWMAVSVSGPVPG